MTGAAKSTVAKAITANFLDGQMLIAMPGMQDPRFHRSLIYLCAIDQSIKMVARCPLWILGLWSHVFVVAVDFGETPQKGDTVMYREEYIPEAVPNADRHHPLRGGLCFVTSVREVPDATQADH